MVDILHFRFSSPRPITCEADAAEFVASKPDVLHVVAVRICRARAGLRVPAHKGLGSEAGVTVVALFDLDLVDREVVLVIELSAFGDLAAWKKCAGQSDNQLRI